jgi:hypothetical protein
MAQTQSCLYNLHLAKAFGTPHIASGLLPSVDPVPLKSGAVDRRQARVGAREGHLGDCFYLPPAQPRPAVENVCQRKLCLETVCVGDVYGGTTGGQDVLEQDSSSALPVVLCSLWFSLSLSEPPVRLSLPEGWADISVKAVPKPPWPPPVLCSTGHPTSIY